MGHMSIPEWIIITRLIGYIYDWLIYIRIGTILLKQWDWERGGIPTKQTFGYYCWKMGKWRLVEKITNEYHRKETKQRISILQGTAKVVESGEEEIGDHRTDKRTNKTRLWGPDELVGAISSGASALHCSFGTKTENSWFVTILWLHFYPHVADLEEIQVDPGAEPPKMLKHLFPWLSLYQDCIKCMYFTSMLLCILTLSRKSRSEIFIWTHLYISTLKRQLLYQSNVIKVKRRECEKRPLLRV